MLSKKLAALALAASLAACASDRTSLTDPYRGRVGAPAPVTMSPIPDAGEQSRFQAYGPLLEASDDDVELMTRTMWGEARHQPDSEMEMIANVIINRVRIGMGGTDIRGVIMADRQFSVWNRCDYKRVSWRERKLVKRHGKWRHARVLRSRTVCRTNRNRNMTMAASDYDPNMVRARAIATKVISGRSDGSLADLSNGADHYHAKYVRPRWAKKRYRVATAPAHIFYNIGMQ